MSFSENLRKELEYQDIQVKELATRTNISKNTLDKYLSKSEVQPSAENAVKIANCLGVSAEYLVTGKCIDKRLQDLQRYIPVMYELRALPNQIQENIVNMIHSIFVSKKFYDAE